MVEGRPQTPGGLVGDRSGPSDGAGGLGGASALPGPGPEPAGNRASPRSDHPGAPSAARSRAIAVSTACSSRPGPGKRPQQLRAGHHPARAAAPAPAASPSRRAARHRSSPSTPPRAPGSPPSPGHRQRRRPSGSPAHTGPGGRGGSAPAERCDPRAPAVPRSPGRRTPAALTAATRRAAHPAAPLARPSSREAAAGALVKVTASRPADGRLDQPVHRRDVLRRQPPVHRDPHHVRAARPQRRNPGSGSPCSWTAMRLPRTPSAPPVQHLGHGLRGGRPPLGEPGGPHGALDLGAARQHLRARQPLEQRAADPQPSAASIQPRKPMAVVATTTSQRTFDATARFAASSSVSSEAARSAARERA